MAELRVARSELILGGAKSGKAARADSLAAAWLAQSPGRRAVCIATAQAWDEEMRERIARCRRREPERAPHMIAVEEPLELAHAIGRHGRADTLIVVDCLTFSLTASLLPAVPGLPPDALREGGRDDREEEGSAAAACGRLPARQGADHSFFPFSWKDARAPAIADALRACAGPIVLLSSEIGPGVLPAGQKARAFLDALGGLNQQAAAACERVTLISAGLPLTLKGAS